MQKVDPYQIVTVLLIVSIILTLVGFIYNLSKGTLGKIALSVDTDYEKGFVLVNGKDKGETPIYLEDVFGGDIDVTINTEGNSYKTSIKPAAGTLAVVKRELGVNGDFSSGQNIWFVKTGGDQSLVSVISPSVDGVSVIVDGVEIGKTPVRFATSDLLSQDAEDRYTITFKKNGYQDQEAEVKVRAGYELTIRVDMFLKPIPENISALSGISDDVTFLNLSNVDNPAFTNKQDWAKAINYWLKTRGEAIFDSKKVAKFNYFIDDKGQFYDEAGNQILVKDVNFESKMFLAYLGSLQTSELTQSAQKSIEEALGTGITIVSDGDISIKIKPTGIGFLRVRSGAGTKNAQVGQVNVGSTFKLLAEENGWYQIEYKKGEKGWVSGTYAEKVKPQEKP